MPSPKKRFPQTLKSLQGKDLTENFKKGIDKSMAAMVFYKGFAQLNIKNQIQCRYSPKFVLLGIEPFEKKIYENMKNSTAKAIESVMEKLPLLNCNGIGNMWDHGEKDAQERFQRKKDILREDIESFEKVCQWLNDKKIGKIKTINRIQTSYVYKHMVEKDVRCYISNGIFIAAAIHCGFDYNLIPGSLNVYFNISQKSISKLKKIE